MGHTKYHWSLPRLRCTLEKRYKELSSAVLLAFVSSILLVTVGAAVVFFIMDVLSVRPTCIFMEAWVWFSIQEQFTCQFCYHVLVLPSRSLTDIWSVVTLKTRSALICLTSLLIRPGAVWSLHWWFVVGLYGLLLGLVRVCIYIYLPLSMFDEKWKLSKELLHHICSLRLDFRCACLSFVPLQPQPFSFTQKLYSPCLSPLCTWLLGTVLDHAAAH